MMPQASLQGARLLLTARICTASPALPCRHEHNRYFSSTLCCRSGARHDQPVLPLLNCGRISRQHLWFAWLHCMHCPVARCLHVLPPVRCFHGPTAPCCHCTVHSLQSRHSLPQCATSYLVSHPASSGSAAAAVPKLWSLACSSCMTLCWMRTACHAGSTLWLHACTCIAGCGQHCLQRGARRCLLLQTARCCRGSQGRPNPILDPSHHPARLAAVPVSTSCSGVCLHPTWHRDDVASASLYCSRLPAK